MGRPLAHLVAAPHTSEHETVAVKDGERPLGKLQRPPKGGLAQVLHKLGAQHPLIVGCVHSRAKMCGGEAVGARACSVMGEQGPRPP